MTNIWESNINLYQDYLNLFQKHHITELTTDILNRFDQIHAGGIKATEKILKYHKFKSDDKVLELGGGIGGVSRLLANKYHIKVINLDISWSYTITGKKLTEMCNDCKDILFMNADATVCPFRDNSLDAIWLQHINMNIKNKVQLFAEVNRILRNKGILIFHEWFLLEKEKEVTLPLPWADDLCSNHLCTFDYFIDIAEKNNFYLSLIEDETNASLIFYKKLLETKAFYNPIFKNRDGETIFKNVIKMIETKTLTVYSGKMVKKL